MKAKELLKRYQAGERDFQGVSLRGLSFKGQELSGANFSGADIRGTNFSNAKLTGADFSRAKAGLQKRWAVILTFASWLLAGISGFFSGALGYWESRIFFDTGNQANILSGWISVVVLIAFFAIFVRKGITAIAIAVAVAVAFSIASIVAITVAKAVTVAGGFIGGFTIGVAGAGAFAITFAFSFSFAVAVSFAVAGVFALAFALAFAFTFALAVAGAGPLAGAGAVAVTVAFSFVPILISAYVGWRALKGDPKHTLINSAAIAFSAWGGTSFRGADLTNASFNHARLKGTDLRKATITRTSWLKTQLLDRVRPGASFLDNLQIRTLVKTGQGQGLELAYENLRGINLAKAQLEGANFRATDLSEANLQDADLTRANLVQTQLGETDLTGACLTGATIEDWGITGDTGLQGVRCEYVYMRFVRPGDPDPNPRRKPDNHAETFEDGEFGDFIKPIVDTLDLYHNQNVDSRAIAIAFKQLAEDNPDANLEIVAMEKRGKDNFLLKAKTAEHADHSSLSQEYFDTYNELRALAQEDVRLQLAEKDDRIRSLESFVDTALKRPSFYAENYQQTGDVMPDNSGVNINAGGNVSGVAGGDISGIVNLGEIVGDVSNSIQQLPKATAPDQPNLKELLTQLQAAISDEAELDDSEKSEALAQVKKLAQAGQAPQEGKMQKLAKRATGMLSGLVSGMTEGAKLVTAWETVGPALIAFFGLL